MTSAVLRYILAALDVPLRFSTLYYTAGVFVGLVLGSAYG